MEKFKELIEITSTKFPEGSFERFGSGFSASDKPYAAGVEATREALSLLKSKEPSFGIAIITNNYDFHKVMEGIKQIVPNTPIVGIVSNLAINYNNASSSAVCVSLISGVDVEVSIAKGYSLGARRSIKDALSKLMDARDEERYNYLMVFSPNSIPLSGQSTVQALEEVADKFEMIFGGVIGELSKIEYQTFLVDSKAYTDHAILVLIRTDRKLRITQAYGFHPLRPFKITGVKGDMITSLDDEPAVDALSRVLSKKGISEADIKDPIKGPKILSRYQFTVMSKNNPNAFRSLVPINLTSRGIRVNAFLEEGLTLWLMEFSSEEIMEAIDKTTTRILSQAKDISGGILFESETRRHLLTTEEYIREKQVIFEYLKVPFMVVETVEEILIGGRFFAGSHTGSLVSVLF